MRHWVGFLVILGMIVVGQTMAMGNRAFYMQRLASRDIDTESKLQCVDSLLNMGVPERDSLEFLKLDLLFSIGRYEDAIEVYTHLRDENKKYPINKECWLRYKFIGALSTANRTHQCMMECLDLLETDKPDSLLYYDAYANELLWEFTRSMEWKLDVDYVKETARLLDYARGHRLGADVETKIARTLHNQKMLAAIYSGDYDAALCEATELMKLPSSKLDQARLDTNVAYIYMAIGRPDLAERYCLQLLSEKGVLYPHGVTLMNYMHLLNKEGRHREALDAFHRYAKAAQIFNDDLYCTYLLCNKAEAEHHLGMEDESFADMMLAKVVTDSLYKSSMAQCGVLAHQMRGVEQRLSKVEPQVKALTGLSVALGVAALVLVTAIIIVAGRLRKCRMECDEKSSNLDEMKGKYDECVRINNDRLQKDDGKIAATMLQLGVIQESFAAIEGVMSNRRKTAEEKLQVIASAIENAKRNTSARDLFEQQFEQAHAPFFRNLYASHPDLSPGETRMCAYLIMNLTSKEIASITNKTVRSVESTRYRICKKFNLPEGQSVVAYLRQFIGS